ncbi:hypothetical protein [Armatimonas rosea]|uniref:Outer membrane protein beta-barrel domain-containing protein n=1 Tax=Armatimonas rosea TaxID=685828 RepID=A0A7W9STE8_ARMRO|nr:hypothetical protein [Armatimonas rosea]MBB6051983.1 hypothetical protein [Armatimonas rosea]
MKSGRGGLCVVATVLALGALAGSAKAQAEPQGVRFWIGPSLGNRDNEIARQTLSAIGYSKALGRDKNESLEFYADAFRVINRPAEVVARKVTDEVIGAGFQRLYKVTDKAGVGAYYGFGLGFYRNRQSDTFLGGGSVTSQSAGGKLLVGTSIDGPFFLQLQLTYMNTRTDFQLGVGQRF